MNDRLTKSRTEHVLAGVCGGIAEQTDLDPTMIRLAFVGAAILIDPPIAVFAYLTLAFLLPDADEGESEGEGASRARRAGGARAFATVEARGDVLSGDRSPGRASQATPGRASRSEHRASSSASSVSSDLGHLLTVAGSVGLVIAKAAMAAATAAAGAAMSAYAAPADRRRRTDGRAGRDNVGDSAVRADGAVARASTKPAPVPTRTSIPVRDPGESGGPGRSPATGPAGDPEGRAPATPESERWLSDEERLEAEARRRVEAELAGARAVLDTADRNERAASASTKRGGRSWVATFGGAVLTVGGAALFLQAVQPGALERLAAPLPASLIPGIVTVWLVLSVVVDSVRRRARRRVSGRG